MNQENVWLLELKKYFPTADLRKWNSFIGVSFIVLTHIHQKVCLYEFKKYDLLLFFSWLRIYVTFDGLALIWRSSRSTVERKCKDVLNFLYQKLKVISLEKIHQLGGKKIGETLIIGSIDTFECNLEKPIDFEDAYKIYSGKKKQCTFKYQILVSIINGIILCVSGDYKGAKHDVSVVRESKLIENLSDYFKRVDDFYGLKVSIIGDEAYKCFDWAVTNNTTTGELHKFVKENRNLVERIIGFLKRFEVLNIQFRNEKCMHKKVVMTIAEVCALEMEKTNNFQNSSDEIIM